MIITRRATFFLGIFIFVIPFLGFPSIWKMALTIISGITLVVLSMKFTLPKKFTPKVRKEKTAPTVVEYVPPPQPLPPPTVVTKVSEVKPRKRRVTKSNGPVS